MGVIERQVTWVTWTGKTAHAVAGRATAGDVRLGGFPVRCGRWAPDPMDNGVAPRPDSRARRCKRCAAAVTEEPHA